MIQILICDDEQTYLNTLSFHVAEFMNTKSLDYNITAILDPTTLSPDHQRFDFAFLDIQMEALNGISLAKKLKSANPKLALFFVTNYEDYQDDAMDLRAFRFLPKPLDPTRLYSGMEKAMEYIDEAYSEIYLITSTQTLYVSVNDILYFTRENRKVKVQTTTGSYILKGNYDEWCDKLPPLFFYHVHKSFFVNLHYVSSYEYTCLILKDKTHIPIAPRKQAAFHKFWFSYLRRQ